VETKEKIILGSASNHAIPASNRNIFVRSTDPSCRSTTAIRMAMDWSIDLMEAKDANEFMNANPIGEPFTRTLWRRGLRTASR